MAQKFKPYEQSTLDAVIATGKLLNISEDSMSYKIVVPDGDDRIITPYYNIITKYHTVIEKYMQKITLDEDELYRYKYKPNLFCYERYGTPELSTALLYMNNMTSVVEFNRANIKIFNPNILTVLNELISLTDYDIKKNRTDLNV